jgi:hypothetical protein
MGVVLAAPRAQRPEQVAEQAEGGEAAEDVVEAHGQSFSLPPTASAKSQKMATPSAR